MLALLFACAPEAADPITCSDADHQCLTGFVTDFLRTPLPGVEVCQYGTSKVACARTAEDGTFELPGLPLAENLTITQTLEGYAPSAYPINTAAIPHYYWAMRMIDDALVETQRSVVDADVEPGTGGLFMEIGTPTTDDPIAWALIEGATVSISPDSGEKHYMNLIYMPDDDLDSTSSVGFAGFMNVAPGDYTVSAVAPSGPCRDELMGWAVGDDGVVVAPVIEGFASWFSVGCLSGE